MATNEKRLERQGVEKFVRLGRMRVSDRAQRKFRAHKADKLLADFNVDLMGIPIVNLRDGWWYIVDGQHRIHALKAYLGKGWEDVQITCTAYEGLTEAEEAQTFLGHSATTPISALDKFNVSVVAKYPTEVAIVAILKERGLHIASNRQTAGSVSAVSALLRVFRQDQGESLKRTLSIIQGAYGDAGFESPVIDGIGRLCQRYNGKLDDKVAIMQLGAMHGGVKGLLGKAEQVRRATGSAKSLCVAAVAVEEINKRKGGSAKRLPSFWKTID